ncbi:MAG: putative bifunctional diguanylate cyclase/phosphodiesterase, partial [Acidimicrobiales bacterium]
LVALGVWAASAKSILVRNRKVSFSVSLTEIPILVAIPFLPPAGTLLAGFFGLLAAQIQKRRAPAKALGNCLALSAATGLATWAYDQGLGGHSPASLWGWVMAAVALAAFTVVDYALIVGALAILNWRWRPPPLEAMLVHGGLDMGICTVGGLTAIVLLQVSTWYIVLFAALVAAADVGWRQAARAAQQHATLDQLYDFAQSLASAEEGERDLLTVVLEGARSLFSCNRAAVVVPLEAPLDELVLRCTLRGEGPVEVEDGVARGELTPLVAAQGSMLVRPGDANEPLLVAAHYGLHEAIVAPLRPGDPVSGYLLVAERAFSHEGFAQGDLQLLEALAANAAVALRRGGLLDKLRHEAAVREYEARHDPLTGLPNRTLFSEQLQDATEAAEDAEVLALVMVDLDGFKRVNDTLGHQAGDLVLVEVARRLGPMANDQTLVARLGGDEFVVLIEGTAGEGPGLAKAEEVWQVIRAPMSIEGLNLDVGASVGVAASSSAQADPVTLLRHAEIAMYKAKAHGGGVRGYEASFERSNVRSLTMAAELRRAIEAGSLELHYQPVVEVPSGKAIGCEALTRWDHERLGRVPPDEFIPVAERAGLIDPLTWWVLDTALAQAKLWRATAPNLSVAVNLSAISLLWPRLAERVEEALARAGLRADALRLELTETSMMAELGSKSLGELAELGVPLSIDDFGTGYSSLSRLRQLPFDEVKIDRSFVSQMCRVSDDEAVVRSVIELARGLDKLATAEGVEDEATLRRLASMGCHAVQGFWLARPLPAAECEAVLRKASRWPGTLAARE